MLSKWPQLDMLAFLRKKNMKGQSKQMGSNSTNDKLRFTSNRPLNTKGSQRIQMEIKVMS
jgi:hypothetical protein